MSLSHLFRRQSAPVGVISRPLVAHDGPPVGRAAAAANGFVLHLRRRRCRRSSTGRTADELTAEPDSGAVGAGDSKIKATATGGRRYTCSWLAGHKRRQSTLVDDPVRRFRPLHLHPVHCGQRRPKVASASARFVCRHPLAKNVQPKDAATDSHQRVAVAHFGRTRSLRCHHRRFPLQTHVRWQQMAAAVVYPLPGK